MVCSQSVLTSAGLVVRVQTETLPAVALKGALCVVAPLLAVVSPLVTLIDIWVNDRKCDYLCCEM